MYAKFCLFLANMVLAKKEESLTISGDLQMSAITSSLISTIPGVTLEVYKENRQLELAEDGYVGKLFSGNVTMLAVVDLDALQSFAYIRTGQDQYTQQKDWIMEPQPWMSEPAKEKQAKRRAFLTGRSFDWGTVVFGVKTELRRNHENLFNTVHYPENMLAIAQYAADPDGELTGRVHVWEIALVSQCGDFFLTVHQHYDIVACLPPNHRGRMCFPRLRKHLLLEKLLVQNAPCDLPLADTNDFVHIPPVTDTTLRRYEGIVENWYWPKNMGSIMTNQGPARVHWTEVPKRGRMHFLEAGEKVTFAELRKAERNPATEYRTVRTPKFKLQAHGIKIKNK